MGAFLMWQPKSGPAKSLYFDACTEEGQEFNSTATEHPVEEGANIADHVKRELTSVTLEVVVSNTPVYDVNDRGGKVSPLKLNVPTYSPPFAATPGAVFSAIGGAVRGLLSGASGTPDANVLQWDTEFDAIGETLATLEELRDTVQLIDVATSHRFHEKMLLSQISVSRDAGSGSTARFNLTFRELRTVAVKIVAAPSPTQVRGHTMKNKGSKPAKKVEDGPKKSILSSAKNQLLGK